MEIHRRDKFVAKNVTHPHRKINIVRLGGEARMKLREPNHCRRVTLRKPS